MRGRSLQEVQFASEMKRRNTRIKELYNRGVKTGNMYLYEQETAKLQTAEMLSAGITHYTKGGVIQFTTSAKKYQSQLGKQANRIKIRTVTELTEKAKERAKEEGASEPQSFEDISNFWYIVNMRRASFSILYREINSNLTESEEELLIPELSGGKGARANMSFDELLNKMADVLGEKGIETDKYRPIPFTDFQPQRE